jgi:hypothetical protein
VLAERLNPQQPQNLDVLGHGLRRRAFEPVADGEDRLGLV